MNPKAIILLCLMMSMSFSLVAQSYKTTYFNKYGLKTRKKNAYTYRTILGQQDSTLKVEDRYMDGTLRMAGTYNTTNPEFLSGPSSVVLRERAFVNYYPSGQVKSKVNYKGGQIDSTLVKYIDSSKIEAHKLEMERHSKIKKYVEIMPVPTYSVNAYLKKKTRYPPQAKKDKASGRVIVQFVVDEEGYITEVNSRSPDIDYRLQMEAIRVVSLMPRWKPGSQNGKPVKVWFTLPIEFDINK